MADTQNNQTGEHEPSRRRVLAGFEIISRVGRGGMGTVYKAKQLSVDRIVALKILAPHLTQNTSFVKRFFKEARAAAKLNHPNVVQAIDAGEADGYYYFAMEFVDGETVHRIITRETMLEEKRALRITLDVARGLDHAFTYGLVHRDVKPGNIMLTQDQITKLCDLGLAVEVKERVSTKKRRFAVGTPYYIAPEMARGASQGDTRSDIYSLGATLFRMLCGRVLFDGPTPAEILHKHIHEPVPWPRDYNSSLSEATCYVLIKMLAKMPEERYQNPSELMSDLRLVLAGRSPAVEGMDIHIPVSRREAGDGGDAPADASEVAESRKRSLAAFLEVRNSVARVAEEQSVSRRDVLGLLRGNLDESRPETFLKYGLIALADGAFRQARADFRAAGRRGADVSAYVDKLDRFGAPSAMVLVSAGPFQAGPPDALREEETEGFYVDVFPVTNADYRAYVEDVGVAPPPGWPDGKVPEGAEELPVVDISWDEAQAYAEWAGKRLPTETEWEKAARGIEGSLYPWGDTFDPERCNVKESGHGALVPVTTMPKGASPYGCLHMAGNARHWTASPAPSSKGDEKGRIIVRGGAFSDTAEKAQTFVRESMPRDARSRRCGFRCVLDL